MANTGARLGAFAFVLAGSFGTAYAIGEALPGHSHGDASHAHEGSDMSGAPLPAGDRSGDYWLVPGMAHHGSAMFHLETSAGPVTQFDETHGALLHTILVRPDLSDFRHVHPTIDADGAWEITVEPGPWHVVFESLPRGAAEPVVVATDLADGVTVESVALPAPDDSVDVAGLRVERAGFEFAVTATDGSPAQGLEPYLGQPAHLVAIRQGDLAYAHLHPQGATPGTFMFGGGLSEAGTYRLFLQFGHSGDVLTVPFTVEIR
jgi:hypothetical protein